MNSKLTLKLDKREIERAKKYTPDKKLSLSGLIENYLDSLTCDQGDEFEISPFVKSISSGKSIPDNTEYKKIRKDYIDHLDKKYGLRLENKTKKIVTSYTISSHVSSGAVDANHGRGEIVGKALLVTPVRRRKISH